MSRLAEEGKRLRSRSSDQGTEQSTPNVSEDALSVIDADTVKDQSGERMRLVGGDAPEYASGSRSGFEPGAESSTQLLENLLRTADTRQREGEDPYGRALTRVERGGENIMNQMIRAGAADPAGMEPSEEALDAEAQRTARRALGIESSTEEQRNRTREEMGSFAQPTVQLNDVDRALRDERSEFRQSVQRGVDTLRATVGAAGRYLDEQTGEGVLDDLGEDQLTDAMLDIQLNPREVESFNEIGEIEGPLQDVGTWVSQVLGENVPTLATMVGGGVAGGITGKAASAAGKGFLKNTFKKSARKKLLQEAGERGILSGAVPRTAATRGATAGAFGSVYPQHLGAGALELMEGDVDLSEANDLWMRAGVASALDTTGANVLASTIFRGLGKQTAKDAVKRTADEAARKGVLREVGEAIGKGAGVGALSEAPIETAHELIYMTARAQHDPDFTIDFDNPEIRDRLIESALAGGTVGGAFGGAGRGASAALGRAIEPREGETLLTEEDDQREAGVSMERAESEPEEAADPTQFFRDTATPTEAPEASVAPEGPASAVPDADTPEASAETRAPTSTEPNTIELERAVDEVLNEEREAPGQEQTAQDSPQVEAGSPRTEEGRTNLGRFLETRTQMGETPEQIASQLNEVESRQLQRNFEVDSPNEAVRRFQESNRGRAPDAQETEQATAAVQDTEQQIEAPDQERMTPDQEQVDGPTEVGDLAGNLPQVRAFVRDRLQQGERPAQIARRLNRDQRQRVQQAFGTESVRDAVRQAQREINTPRQQEGQRQGETDAPEPPEGQTRQRRQRAERQQQPDERDLPTLLEDPVESRPPRLRMNVENRILQGESPSQLNRQLNDRQQRQVRDAYEADNMPQAWARAQANARERRKQDVQSQDEAQEQRRQRPRSRPRSRRPAEREGARRPRTSERARRPDESQRRALGRRTPGTAVDQMTDDAQIADVFNSQRDGVDSTSGQDLPVSISLNFGRKRGKNNKREELSDKTKNNVRRSHEAMAAIINALVPGANLQVRMSDTGMQIDGSLPPPQARENVLFLDPSTLRHLFRSIQVGQSTADKRNQAKLRLPIDLRRQGGKGMRDITFSTPDLTSLGAQVTGTSHGAVSTMSDAEARGALADGLSWVVETFGMEFPRDDNGRPTFGISERAVVRFSTDDDGNTRVRTTWGNPRNNGAFETSKFIERERKKREEEQLNELYEDAVAEQREKRRTRANKERDQYITARADRIRKQVEKLANDGLITEWEAEEFKTTGRTKPESPGRRARANRLHDAIMASFEDSTTEDEGFGGAVQDTSDKGQVRIDETLEGIERGRAQRPVAERARLSDEELTRIQQEELEAEGDTPSVRTTFDATDAPEGTRPEPDDPDTTGEDAQLQTEAQQAAATRAAGNEEARGVRPQDAPAVGTAQRTATDADTAQGLSGVRSREIPQVAEGSTETASQIADAFNQILNAAGVRLDAPPIVADTAQAVKSVADALQERGLLDRATRKELADVWRNDPMGRIVFLRDGNVTRPLVYISPNLRTNRARHRVALHELGHVVVRHTIQNTPESTLQALEEVVGPRDDPALFEENFARMFERWSQGVASAVPRDQVSQRVHDAVRQFFRDLWRTLRRFFRRFNQRLPTDMRFQDFMDLLMDRTRAREGSRVIPRDQLRTDWGRRAAAMLDKNGFSEQASSTFIKFDPAYSQSLNYEPYRDVRAAHRNGAHKKAEQIYNMGKKRFERSREEGVIGVLNQFWSNWGRALDHNVRKTINPETGKPNEFFTWWADQFRKVPGVKERLSPGATITHEQRGVAVRLINKSNDMFSSAEDWYTRLDDDTVRARIDALVEDGVLSERRARYYRELAGKRLSSARRERGKELRRELAENGRRIDRALAPSVQPWHLLPNAVLNAVGAEGPRQHSELQEAGNAMIENREARTAFARQLVREQRQLFDEMYQEARRMGLPIRFRENYVPVVYSPKLIHDLGTDWIKDRVRAWIRDNPQDAQEFINRSRNPEVRTLVGKLSRAEQSARNMRPEVEWTEADIDEFAHAFYDSVTQGEGVFNPEKQTLDERDHSQFQGDAPGPGFQFRKQRRIPASLHAKLADARDRNLVNISQAYARKMAERAAWQRRFGLNDVIRDIDTRFQRARELSQRSRGERDPRYFVRDNPEFRDIWDSVVERHRQEGLREPSMTDMRQHAFELAEEYRDAQVEFHQERYGVNIYDPTAWLKKRLREEAEAGRITQRDHDRAVNEYIPSYTGTLGANTSPAWRRLQQALMVYQAVRVLSLGLFAQIVDVALLVSRVAPGYRREILPMLRDMMRETGTNEQGHATGFRGMQEETRIMGLWQQDMTEHLLNDNMGMLMPYQKLGMTSELFFRYNGMHFATNFMRMMSANLGKRLIQSYNRDNRDDLLAELNITQAEVNAWEADGMPVVMGAMDGKHDGVIGAIHQFTDETVIFPDPSLRPRLGNDRRTAVAWHLKSFMWGYHTQVLERVKNQVVSQWGEQEGMRKMTAAMPAIMLAAFSLPLAMLGMELRWMISDPNRRPSTGSPEYFFEAMQRAGMTGIPQLAIDADAAENYGRPGIVAVSGPTASHAFEIMSDGFPPTGSTIERSLPAYPIVNAVRDKLGG